MNYAILLASLSITALVSGPAAHARDALLLPSEGELAYLTDFSSSTKYMESQLCTRRSLEKKLDQILDQSVGRGKSIRSAAVAVGDKSGRTYVKISGATAETLFDLASLTKVVATAPSIMILRDQGKLRLSQSVHELLPEFRNSKVGQLTVEQLLRHQTGLCDTLPLSRAKRDFYTNAKTGAQHRANAENIRNLLLGIRDRGFSCKRTGSFTYGDLNYILLGEIVARTSGMGLSAFAKANLFDKLGMTETGFNPDPSKHSCASVSRKRRNCEPVDETAFFQMHGIGGHAGLFSTASDLAKFSRMILNGGTHDGERILSADAVRALSTDDLSASRVHHGMGFDIDSKYSENARGSFPTGTSFGHTGFNGTSLWLDPGTSSYTILLTNKKYGGSDARSANPLRRKVANAHHDWLTQKGLTASCPQNYSEGDIARRKKLRSPAADKAVRTAPAPAPAPDATTSRIAK